MTEKQVKVTTHTPQKFQHRTVPEKLEAFLEARGLTLRYLTKLEEGASAYANEGIMPLLEDDLPADKATRRALLDDLRRQRFRKEESGSFVRGDLRVYIQSIEERDYWRAMREHHAEVMDQADTVYEQLEDKMPDEPGLFISREASTVAPASAHNLGGPAFVDAMGLRAKLEAMRQATLEGG